MTEIVAYTDGACKGNPGPGGWGYTARVRTPHGIVWEGAGSERATTNNRMELMGVVKLLEHVPIKIPLHVYSDSTYVVKGITEWRRKWEATGFKKVKNPEIWRRLYTLIDATRPAEAFVITWVKAHAGLEGNERADRLSTSLISKSPHELHTIDHEHKETNVCRGIGMQMDMDTLVNMMSQIYDVHSVFGKEQIVDTLLLLHEPFTHSTDVARTPSACVPLPDIHSGEANDLIDLMKKKHNIYAVKCFMCHRPLTDPISIEMGIGPVCRKVFTEERGTPQTTTDDVRIRNDIERVFTGDLRRAMLRERNVHKLLRALIYYASYLSTKEQKEIRSAGSIAHLFFTLGCPSLAECLLHRVYKHNIKQISPTTTLYSGPHDIVLWKLFVDMFGGHAVPGGIELDAEWSQVVGFVSDYETRERPTVQLTLTDEFIYIKAPFNNQFKDALKSSHSGRWDANSKMWRVSIVNMDAIVSLIGRAFPGYIIDVQSY
uniref:ribonuclease H n=1 Tax=viral metagenome TaxID=1070528 RepID=A0A6C0M0L6_9ZZZZ